MRIINHFPESDSGRIYRGLLLSAALIAPPLLFAPVLANAQEVDASNSDVIVLTPIIIQSQLQYTGEIDGYYAPASGTGIKSGVPLSEVPQSISIVTSTELEVRKPVQIEDAIKYSVGVTPSNWGTDDRFDQFSIRGFALGTGALYRDGLPQKSLSFSSFTTDPYMLERVEVLRGPAGVLYGSNDAGGMVNMITKRPTFERLAEGQLSYGSFGTAEVAVDYSNVLNEAGTLAGRITGLYRDGATETDYSENDRAMLAAGLTWAPTDYTSITVLGHVQKDALTPLNMYPQAGVDYDGSHGFYPDSFPYRQSPFNHFDTKQESIGWDIRHEFGTDFVFNSRMRYAHQDTDYSHLDLAYAAEKGANYYAFHNDEDANTIGLDNSIEWTTTAGNADNSLLVGVAYQRSEIDVDQYTDESLYLVPYRSGSFDFEINGLSLSTKERTIYTEKNVYFQNHLKLDSGTTITSGLRRSWFENRNHDFLETDPELQRDVQENSATTGQIGITHEFANGVTPYLSYAEGFIQNIGENLDGQSLEPSKNKQWEGGVRYEPVSGDFLLSAAVFDLRKTNVSDYVLKDEDGNINGTSTSTFTQAGEARSRGVELEARGKLTDTLQGIVGYTYLDTEITEDIDESKNGKELAFAPHHQVSLWLDWDAKAVLPGLSVGGGVRYTSESFSTQENLRVTPSVTLADMAVRYETDDYNVNLGVTNLFDRDYNGICYDGYACGKGESRKVSLTLSRSF